MGFTSFHNDHGLLTGLADDDHTQYVLRNILTTDGDLFSRTAGAITRIAAVATGQVLASAGTGTPPAWSASPTLTGLTLSGLTLNSVVYAGTSGVLSQNNANFSWNGTDLSLNIAAGTPNAALRARTGGDHIIRGFNASSVQVFGITAAGQLEVGAGAGGYQLDVATNTNAQEDLRFRNTNAGASTALRFLMQVSGGGDSYFQFGGNGFEWAIGKDNTDDSFAIATLSAGDPILGTNNVVTILTSGNVGIGTVSPTISGTGKLHMGANTFRLDTARTPATAGAAGNAGDICWDASFIYVCTATNAWERVAIASW